jgi:hypothetical protein
VDPQFPLDPFGSPVGSRQITFVVAAAMNPPPVDQLKQPFFFFSLYYYYFFFGNAYQFFFVFSETLLKTYFLLWTSHIFQMGPYQNNCQFSLVSKPKIQNTSQNYKKPTVSV